MKKFLILGGAGFIGFHLAKHLIEEGRRVTICDNLLRGNIVKPRDDTPTLTDLVARGLGDQTTVIRSVSENSETVLRIVSSSTPLAAAQPQGCQSPTLTGEAMVAHFPPCFSSPDLD